MKITVRVVDGSSALSRCWLALIIFMAISRPCVADVKEQLITIGSWNIENFLPDAGRQVFEWGTKRNKTDFQTLEKYFQIADADIWSMQELVEVERLNRFEFAQEYHTIISQRQFEGFSKRRKQDIHVAAFVRSSPSVLIRNVFTGESTSEDARNGFTRGILVLQLSIFGNSVYFASVHLKSGCSDVRRLDRDSAEMSENCKILKSQADRIGELVAKYSHKGDGIIVAGDFNRQIQRFGENDQFLQLIKAKASEGEAVVEWYPRTEPRMCRSKKGGSTYAIDYFLVSGNVARRVVNGSFREVQFAEQDVRWGQKVSDHCPITLRLRYRTFK